MTRDINDFSTLDDFLQEEGIAEEVHAQAEERLAYQSTQIVQTEGPMIKFKGRLVWEFSFTPKNAPENTCTLYETEGGAWIAVLDKEGPNCDKTIAAVIEGDSGNEIERRIACMNVWGWSSYVRRAVKDDMGWQLSVRVD
jgi:hypothetical protein